MVGITHNSFNLTIKQECGQISLTFSDMEGKQLSKAYFCADEALLLADTLIEYAGDIINGAKEEL